jgi:hypothetical protein
MRKLLVAAAFVLSAAPVALAGVSGANPGTVVGNVYDNPAVNHGGFGLAPGYGYDRAALGKRHKHGHQTRRLVP